MNVMAKTAWHASTPLSAVVKVWCDRSPPPGMVLVGLTVVPRTGVVERRRLGHRASAVMKSAARGHPVRLLLDLLPGGTRTSSTSQLRTKLIASLANSRDTKTTDVWLRSMTRSIFAAGHHELHQRMSERPEPD